MAAETSSEASRINLRSPAQNPMPTPPTLPPNPDKPLSVVKCLSDFFHLKPVPYKLGKNATTSKSTRLPKFFDLHLQEDLRLKTVVVSEDLTQQISSRKFTLWVRRN